jgi:hypothetical protein
MIVQALTGTAAVVKRFGVERLEGDGSSEIIERSSMVAKSSPGHSEVIVDFSLNSIDPECPVEVADRVTIAAGSHEGKPPIIVCRCHGRIYTDRFAVVRHRPFCIT